jgi:hypothetical protein
MARVFIFGAGASACYRNGYTEEKPPLQSNFWETAFGSEANATMQVRRGSIYNYLSDADLYDEKGREKMTVEGVMTKVHEDIIAAFGSGLGSGETWQEGIHMPITPFSLAQVYQDLVLLCAQTVNNLSCGDPCQNYGALVASLQPDDTLITFNWDTLLDRALWDSGHWQPDTGYGIAFGYVLDGKWRRTPRKVKKSRLRLFKLHGSTNWLIPYTAWDFRDGCRKMIFRPETEHVPVCYFRCESDLPSYQELYTPQGMFCYGFPPNHPEFEAHGCLYPMIVPPSRTKYYSDLPDVLPVLWQEAWERMRRADEIVIIGYSFPETDLMSWELMEEATKWGKIRVTIVDPFPDAVVKRLKDRLGKRVEIEVKAVGFEKFAAALH